MARTSDLSSLRKEYLESELDVTDVNPDPVAQFLVWLGDARRVDIVEPNAMTLATASALGRPSARIVLLKGVDESGFAFFTNRESRKAAELTENPYAALLFHWSPLERQVRIEGPVTTLDKVDSEAYFAVRPRGSQLGAWASPQSRRIATREVLEERLREAEERFDGREVPCPPYWGGYVLRPERIEFWQGRENRLHDRVAYERDERGAWGVFRLAP
jgi:pyridoxamine 5'-phosphate oxidase